MDGSGIMRFYLIGFFLYVVKFSRGRVMWQCLILYKVWSESILSNEINVILKKKFLFRRNAKKWSEKIIIDCMKKNNKLEFINE